MRRGYSILIAGGILLVVSAGIVLPSIYSLNSLAESMSAKISTKDIIRSVLNFNQTAAKESLRSIGIDVGLAFFGILVGIILMVNGIIALVGGIIILVYDRRRDKRSTISR
ncbi:MAG: hypothetical protein ACJ71G_02855 [Nitrososphaeraceae archaeon]